MNIDKHKTHKQNAPQARIKEEQVNLFAIPGGSHMEGCLHYKAVC